MKKTLIIIDFQKDFANENGSLYVPKAERAESGICSYIMNHHEELSDVVFTVDWHTFEDKSFSDNGGIWPIHCVQYSEGASIVDRILHLCNHYKLPIKVFIKGDNPSHEEYGAFEVCNVWGEENGDLLLRGTNYSSTSHVVFNTHNLIVCGLAGDYCVKESTKNLMNHNTPLDIKISILKDGVASIDGGQALDDFMKMYNISIEED